MSYIERQSVEKMLENAQIITDGEWCGYCTDDVNLDSIPAADVVEVRHGRWMTTDAYPHHLYCSVCYKTYAKNAKWVNELDLPTNYCPNCGAPMTDEAVEMMLERMEALKDG